MVPRKGFTLIELMVVMTILVMLAALTAPAFVRQYHEAKLRAAARDIVSLMQYARSQAVVEGTTYRLNVGGDRLWVSYYDTETEQDPNRRDATQPAFVPDESVLGASRALPEGIVIRELQLGDESLAQLSDEALETLDSQRSQLNEEGTPYISFTPSGTTDGARILLENEYESRLVVTLDAITGRTQVLEEDEVAPY